MSETAAKQTTTEKKVKKPVHPDAKKRRKKPCYFCENKTNPDFRDAELLRKYMTERGKIMTQRASGCCSKHQRALAKAIKRSRQIGFVPYTAE